MSKKLNAAIAARDAIASLNEHDGFRYEATRYFIAGMSDNDLVLIADFCVEQERQRWSKSKLDNNGGSR